jgi:Ca2+-binding EF-hand superfamily protein
MLDLDTKFIAVVVDNLEIPEDQKSKIQLQQFLQQYMKKRTQPISRYAFSRAFSVHLVGGCGLLTKAVYTW